MELESPVRLQLELELGLELGLAHSRTDPVRRDVRRRPDVTADEQGPATGMPVPPVGLPERERSIPAGAGTSSRSRSQSNGSSPQRLPPRRAT